MMYGCTGAPRTPRTKSLRSCQANGLSAIRSTAAAMSVSSASANSGDPRRAKYFQMSMRSRVDLGDQRTSLPRRMFAVGAGNHVLHINFLSKAGVQLVDADLQ